MTSVPVTTMEKKVVEVPETVMEKFTVTKPVTNTKEVQETVRDVETKCACAAFCDPPVTSVCATPTNVVSRTVAWHNVRPR